MNNGIVFRGGLPYGPDIKRFNEMFPVSTLTEGAVLTHARLEEAAGVNRKSGRYYGLINSWIAHQRDANQIYMAWEPSTGVRVLNPAELLSRTEIRTRQKIRQTARVVRQFGWVDRSRLDDTGQKRLDHMLRVANAMKDTLDSAKKQLAVELAPVKSLPKPSIRQSA